MLRDYSESLCLGSKVRWNGGTPDYLAPELNQRKAKFTKKCDVFAAGIIFLELITLKSPRLLYESMWPRILGKGLPHSLEKILAISLDADPVNRRSFDEIYKILADNGHIISNLTFCSTSKTKAKNSEERSDTYASSLDSGRVLDSNLNQIDGRGVKSCYSSEVKSSSSAFTDTSKSE